MLYRKFELILIKIGFLQILKVAPKSGQRPCTKSFIFKARPFQSKSFACDAKNFSTGAVAVSDYSNLLLYVCSNNEYLKQNYGCISNTNTNT